MNVSALPIQLVCCLFFSICISACTNEGDPGSVGSFAAVTGSDPHSYAHLDEAQADKLALDLFVDFDRSVLSGTATWDIEHENADHVVFDTDKLSIQAVEQLDANGAATAVAYDLGEDDELLGTALRIPLTANTKSVRITYETSPEADALLWIEAAQTQTGKPFMFSQGQAILTRSWVPIQDSPSNRITYTAKLKVPTNLLALMSASNPQELHADGIYTFEMPEPIPPYLMAIAVGDLVFEPIGEQTGVYAAPGQAKFAATEFAQVDAMLAATERIYGEYPWGRYDILVLPPSFPFGGMENPRLTFATPTILVGDSSLTSLIAHELAHSWSGNLVTNATWDDFWLNEGITTYIERRIMEEVSGRDYAEMLLTLGRQDLEDDLADLAAEDTHLRLHLEGRNPDDGMTDIAYEKGSLLMQSLEMATSRATFDEFLRKYFEEFKFQTITTDKFIVYATENLLKPTNTDFDLAAWIDAPGIPASAVAGPESKLFARVDSLLTVFLAGELFPMHLTGSWSTNEWLYFIRGLPTDLYNNDLATLDDVYNFSDSKNAEIAAAWYELTIRNGYANEILPQIDAFLVRVGRRKFLTPLYRAMKERGMLEQAKEIYGKARPGYHAVTRATMDDLLAFDPAN